MRLTSQMKTECSGFEPTTKSDTGLRDVWLHKVLQPRPTPLKIKTISTKLPTVECDSL